MAFNPDKELKKVNRTYNKKDLIISLFILLIMISIGSSYAIFSIDPQSYEIINSKVGEFTTSDIKMSVLVEGGVQNNFPVKDSGYVYENVKCENGSTGVWDVNTWQLKLAAEGPDKCTVSFVKGTSLIELLLAQYKEGTSTGLIKDISNPDLYYYVGTNEEVANNFLWYGGHQWRVIEFDTKAKSLTLITQHPLSSFQAADTVWMNESKYSSSYISTWLNDYFWNTLDSSIQANILDSTFNIGIYTDVDELTTIKKIGLLDYQQYMRAGGTNSFLDIKDVWWMGNRVNEQVVYASTSDGTVGWSGIWNNLGVRAVLKISDIMITSGEGTLYKSYKVLAKATSTSNVQVGEYINIPYNGDDNACGSDNECIFHVVKKSETGIKIILNGMLPLGESWASDTNDNLTENDLIYINALKPFIANIDSKYITTGEFGVGMYEFDKVGSSYVLVQTPTIISNVGLPTVGELFSSNDITLGYPSYSTIYDTSTLEDISASTIFWTMNRCGTSIICGISGNGYVGKAELSNVLGVRPTLYLKSNLQFTGGSGTAQDPYTLV